MRQIVAQAYSLGEGAVAELVPLIDEPPCDRWIAFQLLELGKPGHDTVNRCLALIRGLASGSGPEAMGASIWLRGWAEKNA